MRPEHKMADQWKLEILRQLRLRRQRESGGFTELILSYGKLQEQVESLRKEITRLEFQNNEQEKQIEELEREGGGGGGAPGGGAQVARANRRIEELQSKMMKQSEQLMEVQKKQIEYADKLADVTGQKRKSEDKLSKKESRIKDLLEANRKAEEKIEDIQKKYDAALKTNQALIDEHQALNITCNSHETKLKETQAENNRLRTQLMAIKARDADRLNEENESFRKKRERQLEDEIRLASEERQPAQLRRASSSSKEGEKKPSRKDKESVSSEPRSLEDTAAPSISPDTLLAAFDAHDNEVCALTFSQEGNYMATGGSDKVVKVWSWRSTQEKMEPKCTLHGSTASIMSVQFDQHSKLVLAASNDYATRIWTFHDQRPKHTLTGHTNKVLAAKFLEDNLKVVTGSHDRTLKIWDLQHKTCSRTLFAGSSCNDVVAWRGMGNTIISGHFDKRIRFWDLRSATANEIAIQGRVTGLDLYPERHLLLCCARDDTIRLIDLRQNSITATLSASGFHVSVDWSRACFSPDGQYVAAGSSDGTLFVWDTFTGKHKAKKEHTKDLVVCAWHPRGQLFASADRNKKVVLWKR